MDRVELEKDVQWDRKIVFGGGGGGGSVGGEASTRL